MYRVPVGACRSLSWGILSVATAAAMLIATIDTADARKRKRGPAKRAAVVTQTYSPSSASVIIDVKSGETLHDLNADSIRHPASLTKIMTLYLLFEQLEAGKIKLTTQMPVSAHASSEPPTQLGLRAGGTLMVEDAIKGLVTKSANDASTTIGEFLGGSEAEFARMMTRKARALGMSKTVYRNAHGLPDEEQVTTARDQATLGIAIQERFPRYYRYFSTSAFAYNGRVLRNHNKLLGRVEGVDGIKTGYTRMSGFNLVTSMRRADRHIVAVVLGGSSGAARDAKMRSLVEGHIMEASTRRTAPTMVAEAPAVAPVEHEIAPAPAARVAAAPERPIGHQLASAGSVPVTFGAVAPVQTLPSPRLGSTDPIKPVVVRTVEVRSAGTSANAKALPSDRPTPVQTASIGPVTLPKQAEPVVNPRPGVLGVLPVAVSAAGKALAPSSAKAATVETPAATAARTASRTGWAIQIGAYPEETEAKQKLSAAKSKVGSLKKADSYTERTNKGAKTYFRARFAGFEERDAAEAACKQLKRSSIQCMALKI